MGDGRWVGLYISNDNVFGLPITCTRPVLNLPGATAPRLMLPSRHMPIGPPILHTSLGIPILQPTAVA